MGRHWGGAGGVYDTKGKGRGQMGSSTDSLVGASDVQSVARLGRGRGTRKSEAPAATVVAVPVCDAGTRGLTTPNRCESSEGADDGQEYPGTHPRRQGSPKFLRIRREDHTADAAGPCPFDHHSRVTAQGEDRLAWLEHAITRREAIARAACDGGEGQWHSGWCPEDELEEGETSGSGVSDERDRTVVYDEGRPSKDQSVHIATNDPESVLRRCAADRKLLDLHGGRGHGCPAYDYDGDLDEFARFYNHEACPVVLHLAEGYGWTGGER